MVSVLVVGGASDSRASTRILADTTGTFEIVAQTNQQQKQDKGYSQRVQNYNAEIARKRRTRTKEGKKKRSTG